MVGELQCRLCAEFQVDNMVFIDNHVSLKHKIEECFQLDFENNLPATICSCCQTKVNDHYEYKQVVLNAQKCLIPLTDNIKLKTLKADHDSEVDNESYIKEEAVHPLDDQCVNSDLNEKKHIETEKCLKNCDSNQVKNLKKQNTSEKQEISKKFVKQKWKDYKWVCVICKKEMLTLEELQSHFSDFHFSAPQYACVECSQTFDILDDFQKHVVNHCIRNCYKCTICERVFHKKCHLTNHLETHSTDRKYVCSDCGKTFTISRSFRRHVVAHSVKLQLKCEHCNKMLSKQAWLAHQKKHQGIKDYICHHCGKSFLYQGNLKEHIRYLHSDIKAYTCEHCQKSFKTKTNLNSHLLMHSTVLLHACEICGKQFRRRRQLDEHKTTHSDDKPFECEFCDKRFGRKRFLQIHIRQHTGERPYKCATCDRDFSNSSNYIKHMRLKHGIPSMRKDYVSKIDKETQK